MHLIVVARNEDHAILAQQVPGDVQARQHHRQPVAVIVAVLLAVLAKETFAHQGAVVGQIVDALEVVLLAFLKTVGIDETVRAGVVGRVDVDQLDLAEVRLLQDLEYL